MSDCSTALEDLKRKRTELKIFFNEFSLKKKNQKKLLFNHSLKVHQGWEPNFSYIINTCNYLNPKTDVQFCDFAYKTQV